MAFADDTSPVGLFLRDVALAWRNIASYPAGHPARAGSVERAFKQLLALLQIEGEVRLGVAPGAMIWQGSRLESTPAQRLSAALQRRNVALLRFHPETGVADLAALLDLLVLDPRLTATTTLGQRLADAGVDTIVAEGFDYSSLELAARDNEKEEPASESDLHEKLLRERLAGRRLDDIAEAESLPAVLEEVGAYFATAGATGAAEMSPELADLVARLPEMVAKALARLADPQRSAIAAQVSGLLPRLSAELRGALFEAAVRSLVADPEAVVALRSLAMSQPPAVLLAVVRRLSQEGAEISSPARALMQEAAEAQHRQATAKMMRNSSPVATGEMLRALFGDEDIDRVGRLEIERPEESLFELPPVAALPAGELASVDDLETAFSDEALDRQLGATMLELMQRPAVRQTALTPLLARLEERFHQCSSQARAAEAVAIFDDLGGLAGTAPEAERSAIRSALSRLATPETAERLVHLVAESEAPGEAIRELFVRLGGSAIPPLVGALTDEKDRARRLRLLEFAAAVGSSIVPEVVRGLRDPRWFVVRNMLVLLRTLGDRTSLREVQRLTEHSDLRVRLEAIKNLLEVEDKMPRQLLARAIHDPDPTLAAAAIDLAGNRGIRQAVDPLLALLQGRRPFGRRRGLRVKALEALGKLGDPLALPPLRRYFTGGFFAGISAAERRAAFASLAGYPAASRASWVALGQQSRDAEIRTLCGRLAAGDQGRHE